MRKVALLVVLAVGIVAGLGCSSPPPASGGGACACKTGCTCPHCGGSAKDCACKK